MSAPLSPSKHSPALNPSPDSLPSRLFACGQCGAIQRLDLSRYGRRASDDVLSRLSDCPWCGADRHLFVLHSGSVPMAVLS